MNTIYTKSAVASLFLTALAAASPSSVAFVPLDLTVPNLRGSAVGMLFEVPIQEPTDSQKKTMLDLIERARTEDLSTFMSQVGGKNSFQAALFARRAGQAEAAVPWKSMHVGSAIFMTTQVSNGPEIPKDDTFPFPLPALSSYTFSFRQAPDGHVQWSSDSSDQEDRFTSLFQNSVGRMGDLIQSLPDGHYYSLLLPLPATYGEAQSITVHVRGGIPKANRQVIHKQGSEESTLDSSNPENFHVLQSTVIVELMEGLKANWQSYLKIDPLGPDVRAQVPTVEYLSGFAEERREKAYGNLGKVSPQQFNYTVKKTQDQLISSGLNVRFIIDSHPYYYVFYNENLAIKFDFIKMTASGLEILGRQKSFGHESIFYNETGARFQEFLKTGKDDKELIAAEKAKAAVSAAP